jgi:hypothetical protein
MKNSHMVHVSHPVPHKIPHMPVPILASNGGAVAVSVSSSVVTSNLIKRM